MPSNVLGIIARGDKSGLGYQTRNLVRMLKPNKLLVVNSQPHFGYKQFHSDWYDGFSGIITKDLVPTLAECRAFLQGVDVILTCETFYNWHLMSLANSNMTRSYLQYNYEFLDYLNNNKLPLPTMFLSPSYWKIDEAKQQLRKPVQYLPPPTFLSDFKKARDVNFARTGKRRFLHILGKEAMHDRNGTRILIDALQHTKADFELVIKSQNELGMRVHDRRVRIDTTNPDDQAELYTDFDAMILPRRYGGLCLPMNEALASGLPVIMSKISPNTRALPTDWLAKAVKTHEFMTRSMTDVYSAYATTVAKKIDWLCEMDDKELSALKAKALEIADDNYSPRVLKSQYEALWTI